MSTFWWIVAMAAAVLAVAAAAAALLVTQYRRFTSAIGRLEGEAAEARERLGVGTAAFHRETEQLKNEQRRLVEERDRLAKQKSSMVEANLAMYELKEKLTEQAEQLKHQKFAMAAANVKLLELNEKLAEEREKSAKLLRNILPERVIADLETNGSSKPELFDNVTVFFSDIVGFTSISRALEPSVLISELNSIFTGFDHIFTGNGCERIKTIGDAYLSVSGMPEPNPDHCASILRSALEARSFLEERNRTSPIRWLMRMGVNSGQVVGGIVGVEKYIYDVFGDTINTAARMEQNSETMKINVSESTYELAKELFDFAPRDPVDVKGKGMMRMFFLNGLKAS